MMKKIFSAIIFMFLLAFSVPLNMFATTSASNTIQSIENPTKSWTISFSDAVDSSKQNLQKINIQSTNKNKLLVSFKLSADSKKVIVQPENPYIFGGTYTLVIPKGFQSATGAIIQKDVVKQFKMSGTALTNISASANSLFTHIIVNGSEEVTKVTVSSEFFAEEIQLLRYNDSFSKGITGLQTGDVLTINAYNRQGHLLERQTYQVK